MRLEYVPLLKIQRDLYDLPRGFERFREYLRTMLGYPPLGLSTRAGLALAAAGL